MQTLSDFSDRIPPMLVKELRQGLRARAFVFQFLIFQGAMLIILLAASAGANPNEAGNTISGIIFFFFAFASLCIQPMRGTSALAMEITANTMEMMVLTRLNSTRIVLGKWFSIISQTALMLVTIIPYLILRYFFGGMNILGEMVLLFMIFFTSAILSAMTVGLSARAGKLMRLLPILLIFMALSVVPRMLMFGSGTPGLVNFCSFEDPNTLPIIAAYLILGSYYGWCALNAGVSVISPPAENHSTVPRLVTVVLVLIATACSFASWMDPELPPIIFSLIIAPAIVVALTEPFILLPPICTPFVQKGALGKAAGFFLYPGWPAGVFFSVVLILLSAGVSLFTGGSALNESHLTGYLSILGSLLLPALLATFFTKTEAKRFTVFITFILMTVLLTILIATFVNIWHREELMWFFVWNPSIFIPMLEESGFNEAKLQLAAIIVNALLLLTLMIRAGQAFHRDRHVIAEAESSLSAEKA